MSAYEMFSKIYKGAVYKETTKDLELTLKNADIDVKKFQAGQIEGSTIETDDVYKCDPDELVMGVEAELKDGHTDNPYVALEIAIGHLVNENPRYYTILNRAGL